MRLKDVKIIYNTGVESYGYQGLENSTGGKRLCRKLKADCIAMMRKGMRNFEVCNEMNVKPVTMSKWRKEV